MPWQRLAEALGLAKGGAFRTALEAVLSGLGLDANDRDGIVPCAPADQSIAFTIAVVSLCAKMAKADGVAVKLEVEAFERLFKLPSEDLANVRRLFDLAKEDVAGFETYADQIARLLADNPGLLRQVLECLFSIAVADGVLHDTEEEFLVEVARRFAIEDGDYRRIRATFVEDRDSAYEVLGLKASASDVEIRARHRELVLENHPDRLVSRGLPVEFIAHAERKLAAINAAYDEIRRERGLA